jgi:hypothetical protein
MVVAPASVFLGTERVEGDTTVGADGLFPAGRFENRLSDSHGHPMFARTLLVGIRRAGAIAGNTSLDVDDVRVVVGVRVGVVDHLYVAVSEDCELESFPLRSFLYLFVSVKSLDNGLGYGFLAPTEGHCLPALTGGLLSKSPRRGSMPSIYYVL